MNRSRAFRRVSLVVLAVVVSVSGVLGAAPVGAVEPSEGPVEALAIATPSISSGLECTMGLYSDGTVVATGNNKYGQISVAGWSDIVAAAAGDSHSVGLRTDGTVVATGDNTYGQCNVSGWTDITAVPGVGYCHTVGLKSDGTVVATGMNIFGQCNVSGWTDIVAVAAGGDHTVGLKSDGTVVATGNNPDGSCNVSGWTDIVMISANTNDTVGLKSNGTVVLAGSNADHYTVGVVSGWRDIVAVSAGGAHTVGLKSNGTVVAIGTNGFGECNVSSWRNIVAISAGFLHTVGLKSDGTVVATGRNQFGQCNVSGWDLDRGARRIAGTSRYGTAIEASKRAYPGGAGAVVIATGQNWPDALGGAALAGVVDGPLLLTSSNALPAAVLAEITRLKATKAYVLGGGSAIGSGVLSSLRTKLGSANVKQIAGTDRYETARKIADEVVALQGAAYTGLALVSRGDNYPDALAGSPIAAAFGAPIILAKPRAGAPALPVGTKRAAILGSSGAVSNSVESALRTALGSTSVTRLGGTSRYETAALVAGYGVSLGLTWDGVGMATGTNFPDALSGGAMLGRFGSVMLLTPGTTLHGSAAHALTDNAAAIDTVFFLGGTSAVSTAVQNSVMAIVE